MKAHKLWNVKEPKDRGTTEERKKNNVTCVYGTGLKDVGTMQQLLGSQRTLESSILNYVLKIPTVTVN